MPPLSFLLSVCSAAKKTTSAISTAQKQSRAEPNTECNNIWLRSNTKLTNWIAGIYLNNILSSLMFYEERRTETDIKRGALWWRCKSGRWAMEAARRKTHLYSDSLYQSASVNLIGTSWSASDGWYQGCLIKNRLYFRRGSWLPSEVHFLPKQVAERLDTKDTSKQPARGRKDKWTECDIAGLLWAFTNDSSYASQSWHMSAPCLMSPSDMRRLQ